LRSSSSRSTASELADLLRQLDDDPLRAADAAEPVAAPGVDLSDELDTAGSQAGEDGVDVFNRECDVAETRGVRRLVPVVALVRRRVELDQLE
jgi:hypothetical protein